MSKFNSGHEYMSIVGLIRKLDDIKELKDELITISDTKSHKQMSLYSIKLANHILEITDIKSEILDRAIEVNKLWLEKKVRFQAGRDIAFEINRLAKEEKDSVRIKVFRLFGQIAATPHVKWHALIASDYAITIINIKYPNDLDEVKKERLYQIALMKEV